MRTQYYTAASLDGLIATDDHSLEWLFALGDVAGRFHDAGLLDDITRPALQLQAARQIGGGFAELRCAVQRAPR